MTDGTQLAMAVVSACDLLDLTKLNSAATAEAASAQLAAAAKPEAVADVDLLVDVQASGISKTGKLELAREEEFASKFDNVEPGALAPTVYILCMRPNCLRVADVLHAHQYVHPMRACSQGRA